eukprot:1853873-Rhodomonas_salina.2
MSSTSSTLSTSISLSEMKEYMKKHEYCKVITKMYGRQRVAFDTSSEAKQAEHAASFAASHARVVHAHYVDQSLCAAITEHFRATHF